MAETERRRTRQVEYNREHGITPKTIRKRVTDVMEGAHEDRRAPSKRSRVAEAEARYADVTPETLPRAVAKLEKEMFRHAEQLEFEEAARVRDEIRRLKEQVLKSA